MEVQTILLLLSCKCFVKSPWFNSGCRNSKTPLDWIWSFAVLMLLWPHHRLETKTNRVIMIALPRDCFQPVIDLHPRPTAVINDSLCCSPFTHIRATFVEKVQRWGSPHNNAASFSFLWDTAGQEDCHLRLIRHYWHDLQHFLQKENL